MTAARLDAAQLSGAQLVLANAERASFAGADLTYADFSYGILVGSDINDCITQKTNLHGVADTGVRWTKHQRDAAKQTDQDRYEAETWQPPP